MYEAQDALDAAYLHPAAQTVQPRSGGGGGWGILSARRGSSTSSDTAAAYAHKQEHEAAALRAQCSAQVQELSVMAEAIEALREERAAAAERLNLQRFKFELLVDLVGDAGTGAVRAGQGSLKMVGGLDGQEAGGQACGRAALLACRNRRAAAG